MTSIATYQEMLFDTAAEFETVDADALARIERLINRAVSRYTNQGYGSDANFDEIIVYDVAATLRDNAISQATSGGWNKVQAGHESVSYGSLTQLGNPYRTRLNELLGTDEDGDGSPNNRTRFGAYMGGTA